eukprot:3604036-Rhodomonas_salina.3
MVEHIEEITPADDFPPAESAEDVSKIRKLEDEEDEIDKKIDNLLLKRKNLMAKLAQLIAEEKSSTMVDSGVQTTVEELGQLDTSGDSSNDAHGGSLFGFGRSKSKAPGAARTTSDTSVGSDDAAERRKRKKSLMESLKSALSKAAKHIKNKTRRSSKEPGPEVTVDVGLKTDFGNERRRSSVHSESDQSAGEVQGEAQGEDLSKELAELNALAGMAIQQRMEDQGQSITEEEGHQILVERDQQVFEEQQMNNTSVNNTSIADELANLSALADSAIEAAQGSGNEFLGAEGEPAEADESASSPLASELQGMLNQISSIGMGSDYETGMEAAPASTTYERENEVPYIPAIPAPVPEPAAVEQQDVEESGVGMLNAQLSAMLSQIGGLDSERTVTGAGEC